MLLLIVQFVAVPATVILCWLGEKKGEVKFIIFCTILWCLIVVLMFFYSSYQYYYFIAAATGLVIGSTPALGRGYLSKIIPKEKRAELFGFNAFASKIATIFGPVVFGFVSVRLNMRIALLTVIPFFVIGVILLLFLQNQIKKEVC